MGVSAILTVLLLASDPVALQASETKAETLQSAEAAFQTGLHLRKKGETGKQAFQEAAAHYEALISQGVSNPALYRNLGHAYVLAEDLPHAILTFHRGLRQYPQDVGLQNSLAAARMLVAYSEDDPLGRPAPERPLPWLPQSVAPWLLLAAVVCYGALCVAFTRWLMTRRSWLITFAILSLLAAALLAGLLVWVILDGEHRQNAETERVLVVLTDDHVLLRKGDSLEYPKRYDAEVNRGVEARWVRERGDWVQIELTGGEIGWVPRNYVLIDRPDRN